MEASQDSPRQAEDRVAALAAYHILDTAPEPGFDDIVLLASSICETPVALVSLVEKNRQWFKARIGFLARETPLGQSVCAHALDQGDVLIIPDLRLDTRTRDNTLVNADPFMRFYAGAVLFTPTGIPLGTLCVIDTKPRPAGLTGTQIDSLKALARQVESQLELRRALYERDTALQKIREAERSYRALQFEGGLQIRESEERYRSLFNSLDAGFCIIEVKFDDSGQPVDYRFVEVNPAFESQTGLKDAEGRWMRDLAPAHEQHWFDIYGRIAVTGEPVRFENAAKQLDDRWYDVHAFRIGEPEQRRVAILFNDISDRRRAELQLQDSEVRLSAALTIAQLGTFTWDMKTADFILDARAREIYGFKKNEGEHEKEVFARVHPDDLPRMLEETKLAQETQARLETQYRIRLPDGSIRIVESLSVMAPSASLLPEKMVGVWSDVTERKKMEDDPRQLNLTLAHQVAERTQERDRIWQVSQDMLLVADLDRVWLSVNPAWTRTLGWTPQELLGRTSAWLEHPDDQQNTRNEVERLTSSDLPLAYTNRFKARDGNYRVLSWTAVPAGGLLYCVARDVTRQTEQAIVLEATEEQLRQSQKMEAVGQLTGGIAHDFNNVLAAIVGSIELLSLRLSQGRMTDLDRHIATASGAADRAVALTNRLLTFSHKQTLNPKPTDVNMLVQGLEELIRRTVGPEIETRVAGPGELWLTLCDPNQLENALLNLCLNARDAMPEGGRLTIETANADVDDRQAAREAVPAGQHVVVRINDTGCGMSAEAIERAFEPFYTTKPPGRGTGLGLSMVYGFVQQSGGHVRIQSDIGRGTTIRLYLPCFRGTVAVQGVMDDITDRRALDDEVILIVDDEVGIRTLLSEFLSDLGYITLEANDGAAGLRLLNSNARIDLLITDIRLTGGMNGPQLADAARRKRSELKVLFVTGYADNAAMGSDGPGTQIMTKPFALNALATTLKTMIVGHQPARGVRST